MYRELLLYCKKYVTTSTSLFIIAIRRAQVELLFVRREVGFGSSISPSYLRVHHDAIPARVTITAHSNSVEICQLPSRIRPDVLKHSYGGCRCSSFFLSFPLVPLSPWLHMPHLRSIFYNLSLVCKTMLVAKKLQTIPKFQILKIVLGWM